jgi:hypothetical protein
MQRKNASAARIAFIARASLRRIALAAVLVLLFTLISRAGGPKSVAGATYFISTATGQPLVWPQGILTYYTDQGDLSPILPNMTANAFVADAFSQWTSVPTAAVTAANAGQLAEDVNGSNVTNIGGTLSMPTDIQPTATSTPIGIVYDNDGSVTSALLGSGAGDASQCFFNAVYGGDDNFAPPATYIHALVVINGQCAQQSSQLVDVEYRLVRVLGNIFGVGWSQVNPNVLTNSPPPKASDFAGFPLMHYSDPVGCVPITRCYANPYRLSADDVAAISRLYPVTPQNQPNFPGKQVLSAATARIHGSVWFTDASGNPTQPMQGVNVVARWIDPTTNLPSRQYVASSVSGFLFTGNAGNPITGFADALGNPLSDWGSTAPGFEGFFDLAGLPLPNGASAQYQLTVEPVDTTWSAGVGSYAPSLVAPSGTGQPIVVSVAAGQNQSQDILMSGTAQPVEPWAGSETWTQPAPVPAAGNWAGSLNSFGDVSFFLLPVQANRTLSVAVKALDESGQPSERKAQPVVGMWAATDPQGTAAPAFTSSPFNTVVNGLTRLDAQVSASGNFLIGISDMRGDGRPDYHYQAQVLYADSLSPARVGVNGGAVAVLGTGFPQGVAAIVGSSTAAPLAVNAGQMLVAAPPFTDGPQSVTITDPTTGSSTTMTNALTYGAAASDTIVLDGNGLNPSTPVGTQAPNPVSVQVLEADGITPVSGATIGWTASKSPHFSACGGASSCAVVTDQSGRAFTWLTPTTVGADTITATLAPGVYNPAKSVSATLSATESASDIGVLTQYLWVSQGATVSLPLTARVLSNGSPQNNAPVNFTVVKGSGTLSAGSARTDSNGNATVTVSLAQISSTVQVSACVGPANAPCQPFYLNPVPLASQTLQQIAGAGQVSAGQAFQPVTVRVTDFSSPPNPVIAAPVSFLSTVLRPGGTSTGGGKSAMPTILGVSLSSAVTELSGVASIVPSSAGFSPPLEVDVAVTAGVGASLDDPEELLPAITGAPAGTPQPPVSRWPVHAPVAVGIERGRTDDWRKIGPDGWRPTSNACR